MLKQTDYNSYQEFTKSTQTKKGVSKMSKKNHVTRLVAIIALAMITLFTMGMPALALDYTTGTDKDTPAAAKITKLFNMPVGVSTPKSDFIFTFTPSGFNQTTDTV